MLRLVNTAINAVTSKIESVTIKQQKYVSTEFFSGNVIFVILLTRFINLLITEMFPGTNLIVIVVSPLVALQEDKIREAFELEITAMQTGVHNTLVIQQGRCQLVFSSISR